MLPLLHGGIFDHKIIENKRGFVSLLIEGKGAKKLFKDEAGGHRWQRVPPTEKKGRVHTSTITVAVLDQLDHSTSFDEKDVELQKSRGSGPGGQHRNTTESCVVAIHKPTGVSVKVDMRSQKRSKDIALQVLKNRVTEAERAEQEAAHSGDRRKQVGSGMRGDKIRTYRSQDNTVTDHRTNKKWQLDKWMKGKW